jgi:hypothetical protein
MPMPRWNPWILEDRATDLELASSVMSQWARLSLLEQRSLLAYQLTELGRLASGTHFPSTVTHGAYDSGFRSPRRNHGDTDQHRSTPRRSRRRAGRRRPGGQASTAQA